MNDNKARLSHEAYISLRDQFDQRLTDLDRVLSVRLLGIEQTATAAFRESELMESKMEKKLAELARRSNFAKGREEGIRMSAAAIFGLILGVSALAAIVGTLSSLWWTG